jgi:hypothetical protein
MARTANTRRVYINDPLDTEALAQEGCRIIEGLVTTFGVGNEIPNLQEQVLSGLMSHPLWHNTGPDAWVNWPDSCVDSFGVYKGLWAIIRGTYPLFRPGFAVMWMPDRTGRPTSRWMVTDDRHLMWTTFELTFNDSRARFNNDVASAAHVIGAHSDAISTAMTEGLDAMWRMGQSVLDASIRFTDDINLNAPATVKARFGWKSVRDAVVAFQNAVNVSNTGTMAVGESLWDMYVDRLASAGLVP